MAARTAFLANYLPMLEKDPRHGPAVAFMEACRWNADDWVRRELAAGRSPNAAIELGVTPLMTAASGGAARVLPLLLDAGADATAARPDGWNALHAMCGMSHARTHAVKVARLLLDAGADPLARTADGRRPIDFAANKPMETPLRDLFEGHAAGTASVSEPAP